MSRQKVDKKTDEMTKFLLSQGVYSLKKSEDAVDKKIMKLLKANEKKVYRFWLGVFYGILLMFSLYWLPLFGPMIAGYVAGRRAGSPAKGTIAAMIIVVLFYIVQSPHIISGFPVNLVAAKESVKSTATAYIPALSPIISFISSYTTPAVSILSGQVSYTPQTYTILLVFAYIGGTMASQKREEIRLMAMGRILSHLPVHPVPEPVPHHSAAPSYPAGQGFGDMEKASLGSGDWELNRIREDEYAPKKSARKSRKRGRPTKAKLNRNLVKHRTKKRMESL